MVGWETTSPILYTMQERVTKMRAKCRICGEVLDTNIAFKVVTNGKNAYYCSQDEFEADEKAKAKASADKDMVYKLICEIIDREKIINTALWKEWNVWNKVATNEIIGQYLMENKEYLIGAIARLDNVEFNRIRYLSAILKNSLGDFKPKIIVSETEKPKVTVDQTFYESTPATRSKRRSLADLEDEF